MMTSAPHSGVRKRFEGSQETQRPANARQRVPRWLAWVGGVALALLVVGGAMVAYVIHNAEPILRRRVITNLEERFHSPVELDALHISLRRGLEVSGSGLRILNFGERDELGARTGNEFPMLSVKGFEFRTGLRELFEPVMRADVVKVSGMQLHIPPKQERGPLISHDQPKQSGKRSIVVDEIVCSDMTLTIETNKPGKQPLVFDIQNVTLRDVGPKHPFLYEALLVNPKPVGNIHSTGHFGPWQDDNPRDTRIDGNYSFTHADLATIKGIGGILSSTGQYGGTLGEIGVTGTTDTPDFSLDVSDHPVDLRTEFDATVDGTSGDTKLNSVHATLLNTVLQVSGTVIRASNMPSNAANGKDVSGHYIDISVVSDQARVEDVLTLGAKTSPPLMQGALTLRARLNIPPGHMSVSQKMRIQGTFAIRGASFSNAKWQETVDKLSIRASGNLKESNPEEAVRVSSEMSGDFALANATLNISRLNYQMPGAQVSLTGKYGLDGKTFDFDGTVRTKATASQMLTGWKSIVAMPLDPLLKKNGAGLEVPIKISGTKSEPKLGLDLGKLGAQIFSRKKDQGQQGPGQHP